MGCDYAKIKWAREDIMRDYNVSSIKGITRLWRKSIKKFIFYFIRRIRWDVTRM